MRIKTVVLLVVLALLVGACVFYPVGEPRVTDDAAPRMVVMADGAGSVTVVPPEPRPTPVPTEYRGKPVISWCMSTVCKPFEKGNR